MKRWRWATASRIGTSHKRLGTRKQDALACFFAALPQPIVCAIIADGAGSSEFGGEGASVVCRLLSQALKAHFRDKDAFPSEEIIWTWLDDIRDKLGYAAERRCARRQDFASTLVLMIASTERTLVAHVGDGAVVARDPAGDWRALSWPVNGEYASTTFFVTDDPAPNLRVVETEQRLDAFALFSDGIEDLALDQRGQTPHAPFFRPLFKSLDASSAEGRDRALSAALGSFLDSERVCERTDDDKSVILISVA